MSKIVDCTGLKFAKFHLAQENLSVGTSSFVSCNSIAVCMLHIIKEK